MNKFAQTILATMPKTITQYSIFIASPNDVQTERNQLEEVLNEINQIYFQAQNIIINVKKWETDTYPGFGEDAQDVINTQIDDDYDIFIGIMWSRFGTPTHRDSSGTKEEFERAYQRLKNGEAIKVMFYFKTAPIPFDQIDTDQINKIKAFKADIEQRGGLWFQFEDAVQLKTLLKHNIVAAVNDLRKEQNSLQLPINTVSEIENTISPIKTIDETPKGILDNVIIASDNITELGSIIKRITEYTGEMTNDFNSSSAQLTEIEHHSSEIKLREARSIIDALSNKMSDYAQKMRNEIPLYRKSNQKGLNAYIELFATYHDQMDQAVVDDYHESIKTFENTIPNALENMMSFRETIAGLPPMTSSLNNARQEVVNGIDELIKEFEFTLEILKSSKS